MEVNLDALENGYALLGRGDLMIENGQPVVTVVITTNSGDILNQPVTLVPNEQGEYDGTFFWELDQYGGKIDSGTASAVNALMQTLE